MFAYIRYGKHKNKNKNKKNRKSDTATMIFRIGSVIALAIKNICWFSYRKLANVEKTMGMYT